MGNELFMFYGKLDELFDTFYFNHLSLYASKFIYMLDFTLKMLFV